MSDIVARVVLTIFYFTLFLPFGLLARFFSDPLSLKPDKKAQWLDRETHDLTIENARRPY